VAILAQSPYVTRSGGALPVEPAADLVRGRPTRGGLGVPTPGTPMFQNRFLRPGCEVGGAHDHELAVFRMDAGDPEQPVVQGAAGSGDGPRSHHRDRERVVSFSPHTREAEEEELRVKRGVAHGRRSMGIPACARPKRSALRAPQGFAPAGTPSSQTPP
jgi:hypothetical protein